MDSRSSILSVFAFLVLVTGPANPACANFVVVYHGDFNFLIPADQSASRGVMADAVITIPYHYAIRDLDVVLNLTHSKVFDLEIKLRSPLGKTILLNKYDYKKDYFDGADYTRTIFDDEAEVGIEQGIAPFTGRFKPRSGNLLAAFDGEDCYGQWTLKINDQFYYNTGTFNDFELVITIPEPKTAIFTVLGLALIGPNRKR